MNNFTHRKTTHLICFLLLISLFLPNALPGKTKCDVRYIDVPNDSSTHWRHFYQGSIVGILKLTFTSNGNYFIEKLQVRPVTNDSLGWYISDIQLWRDIDNNDTLSISADSLIDSVDISGYSFSSSAEIPVKFNNVTASDSVPIINSGNFFIAARVRNFDDIETPGNLAKGIWISLELTEEDISVFPPDDDLFVPAQDTLVYNLHAANQPITVYNSENINHFFPNYITCDNSPESAAQTINDLEFFADVFLPGNYVEDSLTIKSVSFSIGYDNMFLEPVREDFSFGAIWGSYIFNLTTELNNEDIEGYSPNYSFINFQCSINESANSNTKFVKIDSNSIAQFKFRVIKPGVSPIFLREIELLDRWGIPYQTLQDESIVGADTSDAWAKFIPGDFASNGDSGVNDHIGDGKVDITDIALFSNYIWKNQNFDSWYSRFDIGSPDSHDPNECSFDDTTNFYDLLIMGINYYRTQEGAFGKKSRNMEDKPIEISLSDLQQMEKSGEYIAKISLQNAMNLSSAQVKIYYTKESLEFVNILPGNWVRNISPSHVMLYPPELIESGIIDLNFLAFSNSLSGGGDFAILKFRKVGEVKPSITLDYLDLRDINGNKIEYVVKEIEDFIAIPSEFLVLENYPNPFNPATKIHYSIPAGSEGNYRILIYDICGNFIKTLENRHYTAGKYSTVWDGKNEKNAAVASGVYFLRLSGSGKTITKKLMLLQ